MKKRCIVTGGAGFIGSHIIAKLLKMHYEVIAIDDFSTGKKENIKLFLKNPYFSVIKKDICNKSIEKYFKNVKIVFHTAALARVQYSMDYPIKSNHANIEGTLNLLNISHKYGVSRFIYSSSSSIYGDQKKLPFKETYKPNPISPYALQKLTGEYYCQLYYKLYGIETVSLRYFSVYGPKQDPKGAYALLIPKTIDHIMRGKNPTINGDGKQTRDFTYIDDIVSANILASKTKNQKAFGNVFNIGIGKPLSVNYVVKKIIGRKSIKPIHKHSLIEPRNTHADNSKAKKILEWTPEYDFDKGIKKTIAWFKQNKY